MKLKDFNKKLDSISESLAKDKDRVEVAALTVGYVAMIKRIFGQGKDGGGFAIDGSDLGRYTANYQRLRLRKNKGLNLTKNLVFDGNLRDSVQMGKFNQNNVIGFANDDERKIGRHQEDESQTGKAIFGMTKDEAEQTQRALTEEAREALQRALNKK
jgi:hypothetical protein